MEWPSTLAAEGQGAGSRSAAPARARHQLLARRARRRRRRAASRWVQRLPHLRRLEPQQDLASAPVCSRSSFRACLLCDLTTGMCEMLTAGLLAQRRARAAGLASGQGAARQQRPRRAQAAGLGLGPPPTRQRSPRHHHLAPRRLRLLPVGSHWGPALQAPLALLLPSASVQHQAQRHRRQALLLHLALVPAAAPCLPPAGRHLHLEPVLPPAPRRLSLAQQDPLRRAPLIHAIREERVRKRNRNGKRTAQEQKVRRKTRNGEMKSERARARERERERERERRLNQVDRTTESQVFLTRSACLCTRTGLRP